MLLVGLWLSGRGLIHVARPTTEKAAACCILASVAGEKYHITRIHPSTMKDGDNSFFMALTHELTHACRNGLGVTKVYDRDVDEKETELETFARLPKGVISGVHLGYYFYVPEVTALWKAGKTQEAYALAEKLMLEDKEKLERAGEILKGKRLREVVEKVYPETHISRAHFSPGELLDRYFSVETPHGVKADIHLRFKPGETARLQSIIKDIKREYGNDATIYEWRDGKKVLVYSPKK